MVFLVVTVVADVAGVVLLDKAQGLERPGHLIAGVLLLLFGFVMFSFAMRTMPAGVANAVWAGASIVLVLILGRIFLSETISGPQYFCLGLITAGTLGIYLLDRAPVS
jgi:small multidrug resistance pump